MSLQIGTGEIRDALVAALDGLPATVDGKEIALSAHRYQPVTIDRWQAWPVWVNAVPYTPCLAETYWQVLVTLPVADQQTTIDAADQLINAVADAITTIGKITGLRPARLITGPDDASVPVLQFEITI